MASFTMGPDSRFRPGTTLSCYPVNSLGRQLGAAVTTAVVAADSTTTFDGLEDGTRYAAGPAGTGPYAVFWTDDPIATVDFGFDGETVDTGQHYRMIMFANGNVRAIPFATVAPAVPTGLAASARLSSVRLTWTAAPTGTEYVVYRNSVEIARASSASYRDLAVTVGVTYTYQVQTVDTYGQRSAASAGVAAFIDPSLNVAPVVTVKSWPPAVPSNGRTYLRVNARDANAQVLALGLGVDAGTITPTDDPSIWIYEGA
jgi:hypothetical protein